MNKFLFPKLKIENTICPSTAVSWLKGLGFRRSKYKKGIYIDGHERADVVEARKEFVSYMETQVLS